MRSLALLLILAATSLYAQPVHPVALKPGTIAHTPVMAHQARCAALSESLGLLAFGHDRGYPDADVSLFKLDAKGMPSATSVQLRWPVPENLAHLKKLGNYPTGLVFHPKLPRLYLCDISRNVRRRLVVSITPMKSAGLATMAIC